MKEYNYTIIIPHKNIPDLLQRCLDSIPQREDVQVIIVDDNSNPKDVDFVHFPGLNRPYTEVYFDKTGKGAGRARNVGLKYAKGKWVIFADADDFFSPDFDRILDYHKTRNEDIIYYDFKSVESDNIQVECAYNSEKYICNFVSDTSESIRYIHIVPWAKIIRRELLRKTNCKFDEARWGNDTFCMMQIGMSAKKIDISKEILYFQTKRKGSLTSHFCSTQEELACRVKGAIKACNLALKYGYNDAINMLFYYLDTAYERRNLILFMRCIKKIDCHGLKNIIDYFTLNHGLKRRIKIYILVIGGKLIPFKTLY